MFVNPIGYLLFAISLSAKVTYKSFANFSSKKFLKTTGDFHLCNLLMMIFCFIMFAVLAIKNGLSVYSLLLGILFGFAMLINNTFGMLAFSAGPMNVTDLIVTASMLMPAVSGVILYGEKFSLPKLLSTLFLIFFIHLCVKTEKGGPKINKRWLIYTLIAFLSQGAIGVMQKIHQSSEHKDELFGFLAVAFLASLISSAVVTSKKKPTVKLTKGQFAIIGVQGICMFLMHFLNLKLAGFGPSQMFFPISAGSGIILVLLISVFIFKEKMTKRQIVGLIGGIASIIAIAAF